METNMNITIFEHVSTIFKHVSSCFKRILGFETCIEFAKRKLTLFSFIPKVASIVMAF
jgi:hypothetical protein